MSEAGNDALVDQGDRIYALRLGGISAREIAKQFSVTIADVNQAVEAPYGQDRRRVSRRCDRTG